jgi:hypothetical protein
MIAVKKKIFPIGKSPALAILITFGMLAPKLFVIDSSVMCDYLGSPH